MITLTLTEESAQYIIESLLKQISQQDKTPNHPELPLQQSNVLTGRDIQTDCPPGAFRDPLPPLPEGCVMWIARGRFTGAQSDRVIKMPNLYYWHWENGWQRCKHLSGNAYHIQAI